MARRPVPTWYFALVVIRHEGRFLLIQERKHGQKWYIPAGRVESGETFLQGARREVMEEAGIHIEVDGIMRVQHTPMEEGSARMRVIFVARPAEGVDVDDVGGPDALDARWVTVDEAATLPLRGDEVLGMFDYVSESRPIYPVSLLGSEGISILS